MGLKAEQDAGDQILCSLHDDVSKEGGTAVCKVWGCCMPAQGGDGWQCGRSLMKEEGTCPVVALVASGTCL